MDILVPLIIIVFTIIQSIFGVGLLVFGTPTLLLLGYSFTETLSYLLPASISISFLQVYEGWNQIRLYRKNVIFFMLPMVGIGLLVIFVFFSFSLNLLIGIILLITAFIRFSESLNKSFEFFFSRNFKFGFLLTGFIHGLTNLGGALLVIITNGLYKSKKDIQPNIAYAYFFMAFIQIILLIILDEFILTQFSFLFPIISAIIYLILGKALFNFTSEKFYRSLMTFFILIYGILLVSQSF